MFLQIIVIFFSLYGIDAIGVFINSMSYTDTHFSLPIGYRVSISLLLFSLFIFLIILNKYIRFLLATVSSAMWAYLISYGINTYIFDMNDVWLWVIRIFAFFLLLLFHYYPGEIDYILDFDNIQLKRLNKKQYSKIIKANYLQELLEYKNKKCNESYNESKNNFSKKINILKTNDFYTKEVAAIVESINLQINKDNGRLKKIALGIHTNKQLNKAKKEVDQMINRLEVAISDASGKVSEMINQNNLLSKNESAAPLNFFSGCSSEEQYKKRYHALSRAYHPDTGNGDEEMMKRLNAEYETVTKNNK